MQAFIDCKIWHLFYYEILFFKDVKLEDELNCWIEARYSFSTKQDIKMFTSWIQDPKKDCLVEKK